MPRLDYKTCKRCGGHSSEVGQLSHTRLCNGCGISELSANVLALVEHRGPRFHYWRRSIAASVGGVLVDDVLRDEQTAQR